MRLPILLLALLAAGCAALSGPPAREAAACGGDRGIGGTGIRAAVGEDRGIGGTGIGGMAIVGTLTSVGRLCVNGIELALDDATGLDVDGEPARPDVLRVGQVLVVAATARPATAARAARIGVRHVVAGEVEAVPGGRARVAGQAIEVPPAFAPLMRPGAWVAVSGLRRPDGVVVASRIDPRPPGATRVTGLVERRGRQLWIGGARLLASGQLTEGRLPEGRVATLAGRYARGVLAVAQAAPEPVLPFGAPVGRLVTEAFIRP